MEWVLGFAKEIIAAVVFAIGAAAARMYFMIKGLVEKAEAAEKNAKDWQKAHIEALRSISEETAAQTHYLRWLAQNSTGKVPPPPLKDVSK